jgi:hypothetical protein
MPHKGYFFKGKVVPGTKESKDRFTVVLGVSMCGEKLKPMIIGKSNHPRSFPTNKLTYTKFFYYEHSSNAWLTSLIFLKYLLILDVKFKSEERSVALLLDNCSSHHIDETLLSNIKLFFFPVNTTAILQPLDAGFFFFFFFFPFFFSLLNILFSC